MASLSHLATAYSETYEKNGKRLRELASDVEDGEYAGVERHAIIPQVFRTADFFVLLAAQAEREAQLVAVIEALAQRISDLESKKATTGGRSK